MVKTVTPAIGTYSVDSRRAQLIMKRMIQYLVSVDGKTKLLQKADTGLTDDLGTPERLQASLWIERYKTINAKLILYQEPKQLNECIE
jgi:hypothetical protein